MGAIISKIENGGIARKYGFKIGDEIITINGQLLRDIIDYFYLIDVHKLEINFARNGLPHTTVIHKEESEKLGVDFDADVFDGIRTCKSNCIFCFVDQMPKNMRKSLFIKDDDYRLSFLHGNYITLTNLSENDIRRITAQRLSPLYVSVHATDPKTRAELMGNPQAAHLMKFLKKLKEHNIECHTQVVVVPGVNDGKILKKTMQDLYSLFPAVKTVAIVPVGLTKYHCKKNKIRGVRPTEAKQIFELVAKFQKRAEGHLKYPFFFLSDEFYLMLKKEFPRYSHYGHFNQIENGVGLSRKFITDFNRRKRFLPNIIPDKYNVWAITGILGEKVLKPLVKEFSRVKKLKFHLIPVKNDFFGRMVTVTGLLTGSDILKKLQKQLRTMKAPDKIIFPDLLLHNGVFLDDMKPEDIEKKLGIPFREVPTNARGFIEGVIGRK